VEVEVLAVAVCSKEKGVSMAIRKDLTGKVYGNLEVLYLVGIGKGGHSKWLCKCNACGGTKEVEGRHLDDGSYKSCGCMQRYYRHHMTDTRIYAIWCTMKARCNRPSSHKYKSYGGRGIKVCEEWKNFEPFYDWAMKNGYAEDLSIDRIDNDGNYEPSNCRWVTSKMQANNTRQNCKITFNGETHTLKEWSEITGITYSALSHRKARGWEVDKMLTVPMYSSSGRR
jgi:hypothetical protein